MVEGQIRRVWGLGGVFGEACCGLSDAVSLGDGRDEAHNVWQPMNGRVRSVVRGDWGLMWRG